MGATEQRQAIKLAILATEQFFPVLQPDLVEKLFEWARNRAPSFAVSTLRAFYTDWRHFSEWIRNVPGLPAPNHAKTVDIVQYLRAQESLAPVTLRRRCASLAELFDILEVIPNPIRDKRVSREVNKIERKSLNKGDGPATPLRWHEIQQIFRVLSTDLDDLRDRLLIALAYDGMLRASELVSLHVNDLKPLPGRMLGEGPAAIRVQPLRTKKGTPKGYSYTFCSEVTAKWALDWIETVGLAEDDVLICRIDGGQPIISETIKLPASIARVRIALAAKRAGILKAGVSGNSCRNGAMEDLFESGLGVSAASRTRWHFNRSTQLRFPCLQDVMGSDIAKLAVVHRRTRDS